jgi:hypothetical protein
MVGDLAASFMPGLQTASSRVVGVVAERKTRSYKSERMQRITIYNERDDEPHMSAERLAETTEDSGHVKDATSSERFENPLTPEVYTECRETKDQPIP